MRDNRFCVWVCVWGGGVLPLRAHGFGFLVVRRGRCALMKAFGRCHGNGAAASSARVSSSQANKGGEGRIPKLKSKQWREGHRLSKISFRDGVLLSAGWLHINGGEYSQDSSSCFVWGVLLHLSTLSEFPVKGTPCSPSRCFHISVSPPGRPTHKMS